MPPSLHNRSIVGKQFRVGLFIRFQKQIIIENLRGLHRLITRTIDRTARLTGKLAERIDHRHNRDSSSRHFGLGKTLLNNFRCGKRSYPVMHSHQYLFIPSGCISNLIRKEIQSIANRMETRFASVCNPVRDFTTDLPAKHLPIRLVIFWKYQDQTGRRIPAVKSLQRMHQDRLSFHRDKLLRQVASHTQPATSGDYQDISLHHSSSSKTFLTSSSAL